ncbi:MULTISPECIES: hypothetical protein, partial [unclassified Burkholderia]|uniref:hypothetical protein n=1 Tax=unclassified Burkholderia TaxID=2613784 RepID=UPI002ABE871C
NPALPERFKSDTFRATTGISTCVDAASSARTNRPDARGTLRASTPQARDQPSRRLTKYFDKVRVQHTGNGAFSLQDASGDTMKTSTTISIAASPGMRSGAATITPGPLPDASRTLRQACAPDHKQRRRVRARTHHPAAHFIGMSVRVPLPIHHKAKRAC